MDDEHPLAAQRRHAEELEAHGLRQPAREGRQALQLERTDADLRHLPEQRGERTAEVPCQAVGHALEAGQPTAQRHLLVGEVEGTHAAADAAHVAARGDRVGDALEQGVDLVLGEDVGHQRRPYWTMNSVK